MCLKRSRFQIKPKRGRLITKKDKHKCVFTPLGFRRKLERNILDEEPFLAFYFVLCYYDQKYRLGSVSLM